MGLDRVVVDVEWTASAASSDAVVLADVRWYLDGRSGRAAYEAGHLPGAVFVDLDRDLSRPDKGGSTDAIRCRRRPPSLAPSVDGASQTAPP